MSDFLGYRTKDSDAKKTFTIDASPYLTGGETVSSVAWSVPSGITNDGTSNDTTSASIRLAGGSPGEQYRIEVTFTVSNGDTPPAHFLLTVTN